MSQRKKSSAVVGNPQLLRWSVTISCLANPTVTHVELIAAFQRIAQKWAFQKELGMETGFLHYQCQIEVGAKKRCSEIQALLNPITVSRAAIKPTSNNGGSAGFSYAMKNDTRVEGPWTNLRSNPRFDDIKKGLYHWQIMVNSIKPTQRAIHLICDPQGRNGKTVWAEYMAFHTKEAIYLMNYFVTPLELMQFAYEFSKEGKDTFFIVDLPRVKPNPTHLKLITDVLEKLANGVVQETRYKAKQKLLGLTKVVVLSNYELDLDLTHDRVHKWTIRDHELVPVNLQARILWSGELDEQKAAEIKEAYPEPPAPEGEIIGAAAVTTDNLPFDPYDIEALVVPYSNYNVRDDAQMEQ